MTAGKSIRLPRMRPIAVLALAAVTIVLAACSEVKTGTGTAGAKAPAAFDLGGVYRVDLHYGDFTYGSDCPPPARNSQPFDVSYRASAAGPNVTFKNLGQGFDLTGTGQPDGTVMLSGGYNPAPGFRQSGTLSGRWSPPNLQFQAGILSEITPPQGPKQTCTTTAKATGKATSTT